MGKRVLLADDSATIQKLVKMALAGTSYELFSAFDGREALKLVDGAIPDIVLADAIMPDMDGYDLCRAVKDDPRLKGVPVVLLVGRFQPFDESRAEAAGIDERMIKPFSASRLIELIEKLLVKAVPVTEDADPEDGEMDATVHMSPEELAAHTSHWQHDQTAMTEDIQKIEDIEFDEDVPFDDTRVTSELSDADTMLLDDGLSDPNENTADHDFTGPATMELATEDLTDIDEPVPSFANAGSDTQVDQILDDEDFEELEELEESDLLDDSIAEFDAPESMDEDPDPTPQVPIEDLDTGPLKPLEGETKAAAAYSMDEGDTQPVDPPTLEMEGSTFSAYEPQLPEPEDSLAAKGSEDPDTWEESEGAGPIAMSASVSESGMDGDPIVEDRKTQPNLVLGDLNPQPAFDQTSAEKDLDSTVAINDDWLTTDVSNLASPSFDVVAEATSGESTFSPLEEFAATPAETEPPLEVDEELPLEELALDQDTILEDGDFEPLSDAIEEPLADALLVEEAKIEALDPDDDVLDSLDELEPEVEMTSPMDELDALPAADTAFGLPEMEPLATVEVNQGDLDLVSDPNEISQAESQADDDISDTPHLEEIDDNDKMAAALEAPDGEPEMPLIPEEISEVRFDIREDDGEPEPLIVPSEFATEPIALTEESFESDEVEAANDQVEPTRGLLELTDEMLDQLADKVAERVMQKFERDAIREIAWEVVPELSEAIIKKRIYELERAVDQD